MLIIDCALNSILNSVTWILTETENDRIWLVDCGDMKQIIEKANGRSIEGVLLTHAHFDHIYGLPLLLKQYPDCKVYTNDVGCVTLASAKMNMSKYHENPIVVEGPQIRTCKEGDEIRLYEDLTAKVFEMPGHHQSCLAFVIGDYLFTGDAYIPGGKVVTNLPGGNIAQAADSVKRILRLGRGKRICAGHWGSGNGNLGDCHRDNEL